MPRTPMRAAGSDDLIYPCIRTPVIHLHFVEQSEGPLIVLCRGFPELWYSWRRGQIQLSRPSFESPFG